MPEEYDVIEVLISMCGFVLSRSCNEEARGQVILWWSVHGAPISGLLPEVSMGRVQRARSGVIPRAPRTGTVFRSSLVECV